jgi:membrane-bound metal-dependent hydrolase YbcI (DUF457 family)
VGVHSIIALVIVMLIVAYLWYSGHRELAIIVFCVGIGMLSHQLADRMWIPKYIDEWLWPFAGELHTQDPEIWVAKHLPNILSVNFIKY